MNGFLLFLLAFAFIVYGDGKLVNAIDHAGKVIALCVLTLLALFAFALLLTEI